MARIRIRKRMSVPRRSTPPEDEPPKTWVQVVFFPLSMIVISTMAVMILIYLWSTRLPTPPDDHHEEYQQPTSIPFELPSPDHSTPFDPPPKTDPRPSGGIVIEK